MSDLEPLLPSLKHASNSNTLMSKSNKSTQDLTSGSIEKLTNNEEKQMKYQDNHSNKSKFGCLHLCRFLDWIDLMLLSIGLCAVVIYAVALIINVYLLATIPGIFARHYFQAENFPQLNSTFIPSAISNGCPLGIELNLINYERFKHLCNHHEMNVTLPMFLSMASQRLYKNVMKKIKLLFIFGSIELVATFVQYLTMTISTERQITRIRKLLFKSLLQRNLQYYDQHEAGRLNTKLSNNIEMIRRGIGVDLSILVAVILLIILGTAFSLSIDWQLSLISIFLLPLLCSGFWVFSKIVASETEKELSTYSRAGQIVEEVISSFRTVLSLNGSKFEQQRYEKEVKKTRWNTIRKGGVFGIFISWTNFIAYLVYFIAFMFISHLVTINQCPNLDIGNAIVVLVLSTEVISYVAHVGPSFQSVAEAFGASVDVIELIKEAEIDNMNEPDVWVDESFDQPSSDITGDIEFSGVDFQYPTRTDTYAVRNLSFVARAGEKIALVGRSGSGKSTCISLLLRFYEPSSGTITIGSRPITHYSVADLRSSIGVVSQEPVLFNMSIYENILHGKPNATRNEVEEAARQANAHDFIIALPKKYDTIVGENATQLSGGEKQRVALARTLIQQPKILLLDEPTSALDVHSQMLVQEALDQACANRTTIVIAHRLSTIRNADRIYVFQNGTVMEDGTHDTLLKRENGIYKEMISLQYVDTSENQDTNGQETSQDIVRKRITTTNWHLDHSESSWTHEKKTHDIDKPSTSDSVKKTPLFWRLLKMNKPEWVYIVIGCFMSAVSGASQILYAFLLTDILRSYSHCAFHEEYYHAIMYSYYFIFVGVVILFVRFFQFAAFASSGANLTERLRTKAFAALLRQEVAYFDQPENSTSAISTRLLNDAQAVQQTMGTLLGMICETISMLIIGLTFGFLFNHQITLMLFTAIMFIIIVVYLDVQLKRNVHEKSEVYLQRASGAAGEAIYNIRTVKRLMIEKTFLNYYSKLVDQSLSIQIYPAILSAVAYAIYLSTYAFILASLYWRAVVLFERQELSAHDVFMVFAFDIFFLHFQEEVWIIEDDLGASLSAAQSFFDLFDRTPEIDNSSTEGCTLNEVQGNIEFDHVKFSYPSHSPPSNIVNDLQFTVKAGQRVALIGASGCGKSTVIQLLERFYDVTDGEIRFDSVDLRQLNIQWLRSCFGLVNQEPSLFDLTIAENIKYNLENIPLESIYEAAKKANIHDFIRTLPQGYNTRVGHKGMLLSGGEKQRIAIARTLIRQPKVLLFDEATSALDSYNEQMVQRSIEQIQIDNPGQTMLIIAHNLSTIRSCDLICVLQRGRIIEMGNHDELMQRQGIYHRMVIQNN